MKLKKMLALLLALMMALALVACGDTADTGNDAPDDQQVEDNSGDTGDTGDTASPEGQSLLEILKDRFVAAPEMAGTYWTFIGGYVQGKQMTEDQTNEVLSQLDNEYAFYFDENGAVSLTEGTDTVTAGTYTISEDGMLASISMDNDIKYAGSFIEQDDGPVMVALLDGTGMNALYFQEIIEG